MPFADGDGKLRVDQAAIDRLEADCDDANAALPELKSFVLPGGSESAARLHIARAVCRRAERDVLDGGGRAGPSTRSRAVYLNRLSDLLFILARAANAGGDEPLWLPGRRALSRRSDASIGQTPGVATTEEPPARDGPLAARAVRDGA